MLFQDEEGATYEGWAFGAWIEPIKDETDIVQEPEYPSEAALAQLAAIGPDIREPIHLKNPYAVIEEGGIKLYPSPEPINPLLSVPQSVLVEVAATNGPAELYDGIYDTWYRIRYEGTEGWAFGGYLQPLGREYTVKETTVESFEFQTHLTYAHIRADSEIYHVLRDPGSHIYRMMK